jgi:hypothetical protein
MSLIDGPFLFLKDIIPVSVFNEPVFKFAYCL